MKLITTKYTVCHTGLPKEFDGFRIAVLSDLHDSVYGTDNTHLYNLTKMAAPDAIMIAGDLVTARSDRNYAPAISLLEKLGTYRRVYYGLGNHEQKIYDSMYHGGLEETYFETLGKIDGISVLDNEAVICERGGARLRIAGLTIDKRYYDKGVKRTMPKDYVAGKLGIKPADFTILLAHNPVYFDAYADWGAELILSGHIHGGIVRLPYLGGLISPQLSLFPKYDRGLFTKENSVMVVSAGLGLHTVPIRPWNPGELLIIQLSHSDSIGQH